VIEFINSKGIPVLAASKIMNINPKNIRRWINNGIEKKRGQGRQIADPIME